MARAKAEVRLAALHRGRDDQPGAGLITQVEQFVLERVTELSY